MLATKNDDVIHKQPLIFEIALKSVFPCSVVSTMCIADCFYRYILPIILPDLPITLLLHWLTLKTKDDLPQNVIQAKSNHSQTF